MKPILGITIGLFLAAFAAPSWAVFPTHLWSQRAGSTLGDVAIALTVDGSGNVLVVGSFQGTVDFGGGPLVSAAGQDAFVVKYNASGVHQWSKRFGGTGNDASFSVAVDGSGNVVVVGGFPGTADFGGGPFVSAGSQDIFIAKYDGGGAHLWSKRIGGIFPDQALGVALDGSGNVVVTGIFADTVDFGGGPIASVAGITDIFVAKYDASGTHQWSKGLGGTSNDIGRAVAVDGSGNVFVTGYFQGTVDFGGGPLSSSGSDDIYVARYDASGSHQWSQRFGDVSADQGGSIAVDASGNVFVTGFFQGAVDFGGGPLISAGVQDIFVAKYDASGPHQWSRRFGSTGLDVGRSVALDGSENAVVTGLFNGTVDFGGGNFVSAGEADLFMATYDRLSGALVWSAHYGGTLTDSGADVAVDGSGNVVLTGTFQGSVSFGGASLVSAGGSDIFVAKFGEEEPIPVLISRFDATPHEGSVELTWELWSDEALAGFTLFRGQGQSSPVVIAAGSAQTTHSYADASVEAGETYQYELMIRTVNGDEFRSPVATVTIPRAVMTLAQNFPNPFNPQTTIEYTVSARAPISIEIFDASGALVRRFDEGVRAAGSYSVEWNGRDMANRPMGSGVYFYRLSGVKGVEAKKMVLIK